VEASSFVEDGEFDGIFEIEGRGILYKIPDAAMQRIIACVNACAGVPTEDLVSGRAQIISVDVVNLLDKEAPDGHGDEA